MSGDDTHEDDFDDTTSFSPSAADMCTASKVYREASSIENLVCHHEHAVDGYSMLHTKRID